MRKSPVSAEQYAKKYTLVLVWYFLAALGKLQFYHSIEKAD
ncbi:hypothetical protein [Vagococcus silagei]|nr:hypothetical protein [Vagococcus silagei]